MAEIDLMKRYPKTKRGDIIGERIKVSEKDREIAMQFGWEYFDGPRHLGLGGYHYDEKYFKPVVEDMIKHYNLSNDSSILDVGCGKGFMLHDFKKALPGIDVGGVDISEYCLDNALKTVRPFLQLASCDKLPYADDSFDLVISIATIHNLDISGVRDSLREIMRVSKKHAYIKVNGYENENEKKELEDWNLVAKTILHVNEWKNIFLDVGYTGDYWWFKPNN